jgi:ion channel-forming bestrophin family protein
MSGYDRYWTGRQGWSDLIRNARTLSRLIWFHVPLRLVPPLANGGKPSADAEEAAKQVMAEKRVALDLVEACVQRPRLAADC